MAPRRPLLTVALALLGLALGCGDLRPDQAAGALVGSQRKSSEVQRPVPKDIITRPLIKRGPSDPSPAEPTPAEPTPAELTPRAEDGALAGTTAAHNNVRAGVGVPPLAWDPAIAGFAQAWADHLAKANNCQLSHRPADAQPYGENLYWSTSPTTQGAAAVASWIAEAAGYDASTGACDGVCGHYTQVVWGATTQLGCGIRSCASGVIVVCNYNPRGNYVGQKPY